MFSEGFLTSCSFDYLTSNDETKAFVGTMFVICYVIPMSFIIYFYSQIVCHVFNHEKALREQVTTNFQTKTPIYMYMLILMFHICRFNGIQTY